MPAINEAERLRRDVQSLVDAVDLGLRPGSKSPMTAKEQRAVRAEIEACMQRLDELRARLTG
ncbi:MAG TPA: hypothetical protein VGN80_02915 [Devosiaceae bacterium]|jgi:hypothetical protein|nr:hypothetical protein [Devosiaceae bacterium]